MDIEITQEELLLEYAVRDLEKRMLAKRLAALMEQHRALQVEHETLKASLPVNGNDCDDSLETRMPRPSFPRNLRTSEGSG